VAGYRIEIVPYDPSWPKAYEEERNRLAQAIGAHVLRFEHMGSTAVPELESKPIIDISAAVADLSQVPSLFEALEDLGYTPTEEQANDRFDLWRMGDKPYPTHILHFMQEGSDAWVRPIIFRNALRADPVLRKEYSDIKHELAGACGEDIKKYGHGKTEFIESVIAEMLDESA